MSAGFAIASDSDAYMQRELIGSRFTKWRYSNNAGASPSSSRTSRH